MLNNIGIVFTSGIGNEIVENIKYDCMSGTEGQVE